MTGNISYLDGQKELFCASPEPASNQLSWLESRHLLSLNDAIIIARISCLRIGFIDILRPICKVNGNYMYLKFNAISSPGGETVSVYANTGYKKPIISRE
ncbi:unnamed protein product [Fusarium fujikuroi]|uniref:Uncharacterized protein n=1 Tax=Fusarium fujikuroi TaxID=5127 RepID=A0A9Q9UEU8_FUSFU|nr:unnamed protein product [Fusarium fujikuroi]